MGVGELDRHWDLVIIGGGITGAGVLREAVRMGLKVLLVEKGDFAWGTSGRSSKLVHGGLRYLKQAQVHLTFESVRQRQRLLAEAPGLVDALDFLIPVYRNRGPGRFSLSAGLHLYDLMAKGRKHRFYSRTAFAEMIPGIETRALTGGFRFMDAQTDDARLVLRLINESLEEGGFALNYTAAHRIIRNRQNEVTGIGIRDAETGESAILSTPCVINATGAWAETLHPVHESGLHLRPLRGSHLVIGIDRLPLDRAVTLIHPEDNRPLFVIPWEGAVILGTTDVDHSTDINAEITATAEEVRYMLECLQAYFPGARIGPEDCISSFAGIRPVLTKKEAADPSRESRDHVTWTDRGLVTVTGGKLTTFRILAADALREAAPYVTGQNAVNTSAPTFRTNPDDPGVQRNIPADIRRRLYGRYGKTAARILQNAAPEELFLIPGTRTLWAELPELAGSEHVRHLTDLLLRRVRVGMILPEGGGRHLDRIQKLCRDHLSWDDNRWRLERRMYTDYWRHALRVPL